MRTDTMWKCHLNFNCKECMVKKIVFVEYLLKDIKKYNLIFSQVINPTQPRHFFDNK